MTLSFLLVFAIYALILSVALGTSGLRGAGFHIGSFLRTERISRADVADFMLNQLSDDRYLRSAPGLAW